MASPLGVPVKLLHEALGHIITVELKTGQMYRGKLLEGKSPPIASWWLPAIPRAYIEYSADFYAFLIWIHVH